MKAVHDRTQIAKVLKRYKPTISRDLKRDTVVYGDNLPNNAYELSLERAQKSRNAPAVEPWVQKEAFSLR